MLEEFKKFALRGNVIDLAVGVIIGAAFTGVVGSLVKDVINPVIGILTGGIDFSNVFVALNGKHYDTLAEAQKAGAATLNVGLFLNAIIQFLIVSFAVFWMVRVLSHMNIKSGAKPPPSKTETLLTEIRDILNDKK